MRIFPDDAALEALCRRYGIRRLSLFGSTLKGTSNPGSDVDLLVELQPGANPSLLVSDRRKPLQEIIGLPVSRVNTSDWRAAARRYRVWGASGSSVPATLPPARQTHRSPRSSQCLRRRYRRPSSRITRTCS